MTCGIYLTLDTHGYEKLARHTNCQIAKYTMLYAFCEMLARLANCNLRNVFCVMRNAVCVMLNAFQQKRQMFNLIGRNVALYDTINSNCFYKLMLRQLLVVPGWCKRMQRHVHFKCIKHSARSITHSAKRISYSTRSISQFAWRAGLHGCWLR